MCIRDRYRRGYYRFEDLSRLEPGKLQSELNDCGLKLDRSASQRWIQNAERFSSASSAQAAGEERNRSGQSRQEETASSSRQSSTDDLTKIKGIGPATQKRLHAEGIFSFEQIARLDGQQIAELLGDLNGQFALVDPETWAAQARELCGSSSEFRQESNLVSEIKELSDAAAEVASDSKPERIVETRRI